MTNEEMRIAIARSLGMMDIAFSLASNTLRCYDRKDVMSCEVPNYPEDLNACRDFETTILKSNDEEKWFKYDRMLGQITETFTWYATAEQKCEAFLRVKGLWKEESK